MRFFQHLSRLAIATGFAAILPWATAVADYSQIDALAQSQLVNKSGSDQSMQASTTNAMTALMKLAAADRAGAISKGYQAFGQYRNSGDLDGLRLKNSITALKMDSIGNYLSSSGNSAIFMAPISQYSTSYARLDPTFLRQGDAGKVADEFEKQTGMKREAFLKKMAQASESDIKSSDPQLVDKVLSRFEGFVSEIPNKDFRDKVQKQIESVPQTMRTGLISQAVQKFSQLFAGAAVAPSKSDIAIMQKEAKKASETGAALAATTAKGGESRAAFTGLKPEDRAPASTGMALAERREFRNINDDKFGTDAIGGALQTALDEQDGEDTIFKQISRKYRTLSPALTQKVLQAM